MVQILWPDYKIKTDGLRKEAVFISAPGHKLADCSSQGLNDFSDLRHNLSSRFIIEATPIAGRATVFREAIRGRLGPIAHNRLARR